MRLILIVCLSLLGCREAAKPAPSEPTKQSAEVSTEKPPADHLKAPFLWSVKKGNEQGYLFGTMHMGVDAKKRFPQYIWDTLGKATSVCAEADITDPRLMGAMSNPNGPPLDEALGPDAWKQFVAIVGEGMANGLKTMRPFAAASFLMLKALPMTPPMDSVILQEGKSQGKKVEYLEDAMFQLDLLSKQMGIAELKELIVNYEKNKESMKELLFAYVEGDEGKMNTLMLDTTSWGTTDPAKVKEMLEALLYKRNADWKPKYVKMMQQGVPFCAVGAAHLIGKRSLNDLLEQDGYTVTRLNQ